MRVLVDTSIWIRFLAGKEPFAEGLGELLGADDVLGHQLVYGELLVGNRGSRDAALAMYGLMSQARTAEHDEVVDLVKRQRLGGRGIGWIDAHLLASALIEGTALWTADGSLASAATDLDVLHRLARA